MRLNLQGADINPEAVKHFPKEWNVQFTAPEISNWLEWVWRAWHRLSLDRPLYSGGMGAPIPGRISWQSVAAWAAHHGQDAGLLDKAVVAMDTVYLEWAAERMKANG